MHSRKACEMVQGQEHKGKISDYIIWSAGVFLQTYFYYRASQLRAAIVSQFYCAETGK